MSRKRVLGLILLGVGGLACLLGAIRLERGGASEEAEGPGLAGSGALVFAGLVAMVGGGIVFARSFLEVE